MKADAGAVIVAGGQGQRFGGPVRKQYLSLLGKPILWWSLQAFSKVAAFSEIVLVVPSDDIPTLDRKANQWRFSKLRFIVPGGATRTDSVLNGLQALSSNIQWVAVHDAVRPLVTSADIENVLRETRKSRAALAATPSRDTVKVADAKHTIQETPDRACVWLAQTPQMFKRTVLEKAYALRKPGSLTDDAQLVEQSGVPVKVVNTSPENIKVTVPMDFEIAKIILKKRMSAA